MNNSNATENLVLQSGEPTSLLSHMAAYGLVSILETENPRVRLAWTGGMNTRLEVSGPGLSGDAIAETLIRHAKERIQPGSWIAEQTGPGVLKGQPRGLMSPRMAPVSDWRGLQDQRHSVLDRLGRDREWGDLRLIWSLGEPCYWQFYEGELRQDYASSRFEMQPRNHGNEIVNQRFAHLSKIVAKLAATRVVESLRGESVSVRLKSDQPGFRGPGPVDDVISWCALWGISQFPLTHFTRREAVSSGHIGEWSSGSFYVPVWAGRWSPGRLRSMLASGQMRAFVGGTSKTGSAGERGEPPERWLGARGVKALVVFPTSRHGSTQCSERRAQRGVLRLVTADR